MKERRNFIKWVKIHRKVLVIAGVSIVGPIAIIVGIKKQGSHKSTLALPA